MYCLLINFVLYYHVVASYSSSKTEQSAKSNQLMTTADGLQVCWEYSMFFQFYAHKLYYECVPEKDWYADHIIFLFLFFFFFFFFKGMLQHFKKILTASPSYILLCSLELHQ